MVPHTDIGLIQSSERLAEVILGAPAENAANETVMANRDQLRELEGERRHARTSREGKCAHLVPAIRAGVTQLTPLTR